MYATISLVYDGCYVLQFISWPFFVDCNMTRYVGYKGKHVFFDKSMIKFKFKLFFISFFLFVNSERSCYTFTERFVFEVQTPGSWRQIWGNIILILLQNLTVDHTTLDKIYWQNSFVHIFTKHAALDPPLPPKNTARTY